MTISQGYIVAEELEDGSSGRQVGSDDDSVALFKDLEVAMATLAAVAAESPADPKMAIFRINMVVVGKVVVA